MSTSTNPASLLLSKHLSTLMSNHTQWGSLISSDCKWEWPYAASFNPHMPSFIHGHTAILQCAKEMSEGITERYSHIHIYDIENGSVNDGGAIGVAEYTVETVWKSTGKTSIQQCVTFLGATSDGQQISWLKDYFDPLVVLEGMGGCGSENQERQQECSVPAVEKEIHLNINDSTTNPACHLLSQHIHLLISDIAKWETLITDNIIWKCPYAAHFGKGADLIQGKQQVLHHALLIHQSVQDWKFSYIKVYDIKENHTSNNIPIAVAEFTGQGIVKSTGNVLKQDYVMFLRTSVDGKKIAFINEFYDPMRLAQATGMSIAIGKDTPVVSEENKSAD